MAVTVTVKDGDKSRSYTVKDFDQLTLADWKALTVPTMPADAKADAAAGYELLKRHTGIPKAHLQRLSTADAQALMDAIGDTLKQALEEGARDRPDYTPPPTITHAGVIYRVPIDLERDTIWQQWEEIDGALSLEHEADIFLHFLAHLLVEDGKAYSAADIADKYTAFASMLMVDVFALSAFFFGSSERYRNAIGRCSSLFVSSLRRKGLRALKSSANAGVSDPKPTPSPE